MKFKSLPHPSSINNELSFVRSNEIWTVCFILFSPFNVLVVLKAETAFSVLFSSTNLKIQEVFKVFLLLDLYAFDLDTGRSRSSQLLGDREVLQSVKSAMCEEWFSRDYHEKMTLTQKFASTKNFTIFDLSSWKSVKMIIWVGNITWISCKLG